SRILGAGDGRGGVAVALLSTLVVFALLGYAVTQAPGWHEVRTTFFNWHEFRSSFPEIARAFKLNVKIFCIAEVFILAFALFLAGIESVHPSQEAAARSLGLTRLQGLRYVILPQAVRRVIPLLLNDFIGLQKDTALVGTLGAVEAFQQSQIDTNATFNYTPYL